MLPAPGQGAIALECRRGDSALAAAVGSLHHERTARAVRAERAFLAALGGGCNVPWGLLRRRAGNSFSPHSLLAAMDRSSFVASAAGTTPPAWDGGWPRHSLPAGPRPSWPDDRRPGRAPDGAAHPGHAAEGAGGIPQCAAPRPGRRCSSRSAPLDWGPLDGAARQAVLRRFLATRSSRSRRRTILGLTGLPKLAVVGRHPQAFSAFAGRPDQPARPTARRSVVLRCWTFPPPVSPS
jgi:hypothetical protein